MSLKNRLTSMIRKKLENGLEKLTDIPMESLYMIRGRAAVVGSTFRSGMRSRIGISVRCVVRI